MTFDLITTFTALKKENASIQIQGRINIAAFHDTLNSLDRSSTFLVSESALKWGRTAEESRDSYNFLYLSLSYDLNIEGVKKAHEINSKHNVHLYMLKVANERLKTP
ncbi:CLUMA_CG019807, isoform A [Clunio marinus]|uniref:CLUMA_CG019807, isoform A n=1 Tax=Clunio marinus TaxID=568069 RepID=A0A1J1J6V3_9DIPT|nr:CLUMA_CG019807, isoform A [Clunio marinus]